MPTSAATGAGASNRVISIHFETKSPDALSSFSIPGRRSLMRLAFALPLLFAAFPALAQMGPSHCIALSQAPTPLVHKASFGADLTTEEVRLNYVSHSTFLIETPKGATIATDFTGFLGNSHIPTIVTMNHAHSSHYTTSPDPRIPHILRGWGTEGKPAAHYLELDDLIVRNVTTDIRSSWSGQEEDGNSIFIFEVAGLCIGHLGHLHHEPSEDQYARIGRLDVVMAPVDGGMTLPTLEMIKVLKRLKARVVIPMHWFGDGTLAAFVDGMRDEFSVEYLDENFTTVTLRDLPREPTIRVMPPRYLPEIE
jgi:L-ascorbate metabolism protein UlaG (beta-lactamase superfamily)